MEMSRIAMMTLALAAVATAAGCASIDGQLCGTDGNDMNLAYARGIAESSECVMEGTLGEEAFCNNATGTWWIDLNVQREGCNPACVIDVETGKAEINWRCTGLAG